MPQAAQQENSLNRAAQAGIVNLPGMRTFSQPSLTICSIAPVRCLTVQNHMRMIENPDYDPNAPAGHPNSFPQTTVFKTAYLITPPKRPFNPHDAQVSKECYSLMHVYDSGQWVRDTSDPQGKRWAVAPIGVDILARSLVQKFTETVSARGDARLGIDIIAGTQPTKKELLFLHEMQQRYAAVIIQQADQFWFERDFKRITNLHQDLARWMGATDKEWVTQLSSETMKQCVACTAHIPQRALRCPRCSENLVEFMIKMFDYYTADQLQEMDPHCFELSQKARTARAAQAREAARIRRQDKKREAEAVAAGRRSGEQEAAEAEVDAAAEEASEEEAAPAEA